MLFLVIAESSLEVIPQRIIGHLQIQRYAQRLRKKPEFMLLDKSYHYKAMAILKYKEKRGRPDIAHLTMLEALGSPISLEGLLKIYVHTIDNQVIDVNPKIRLPRNYNRFAGLMEQLFREKAISNGAELLLTLEESSILKLKEKIRPSFTVALTRLGKPRTPFETARILAEQEKPCLFVGGFSHGHFSVETIEASDEKVCIDPGGLDAWIAISRVLSAYEETIGLPANRLKRL